MNLDNLAAWRQIPPEEKIALMSRAHSQGILASVIMIVVCCTVAVGLQLSWIMWGSFLICPFVFQFAAGKAWRDIRPRLMLEYLAARAAARRYAFTAKSTMLEPALCFRGQLEHLFDEDKVMEALEASIENNHKIAAWIVLFPDAVIAMSERPGGARLEFAHLINDKLAISGESPESEKEYSRHRAVTVGYEDKNRGSRKIRIRSEYPAALMVFEKKAQEFKKEAQIRYEEVIKDVGVGLLLGDASEEEL